MELNIELDHLILEVTNPATVAEFFRSVLGLAPVRLPEFERGEAPFPSVRVTEGLVIDLFPASLWREPNPQNPNHLCFNLSAPSLEHVRQTLSRLNIEVTKTDDQNFGARGWGRSLYFQGPDQLLLEVRSYEP